MSSSSDIVLAGTSWLPPINKDCPICHNLNAAVIARFPWTWITIHESEEFRRSATESCLGCKVIRDGIIHMTSSTETFPEGCLTYWAEHDTSPDEAGLFAHMYCKVPSSREAMRLRFYTLPGELSVWDVIQETPEPSSDSTSDEAMTKVKKWLSVCCSRHSECVQSETPLPTRILSISDDDKEPPRLVTPEGKCGAYAALSWRWGVEEPLRTTKENLQQHLRKMPWLYLPKLFRDAAKVTKRLGLRYLWIDAICIIQDSEEDWVTEASKMTEVYGNAYLTIAADNCGNAFQGLSSDGPFRDLLRSKFQTQCPSRSSHGTTNVRVRKLENKTSQGYHGDDALPPSFLEARGWCLQEMLLSRRVLRFGQTEIAWQCQEMECCECPKNARVSTRVYDHDMAYLKSDFLRRINVADNWIRIIGNFTRRDLSRNTDRLPAIEGIAKRIIMRDRLSESDYLVGLWRSRLGEELIWHTDRSAYGLIRHAEPGRKSQRLDNIPTWSWASVTGAVEFLSNSDVQVEEVATPPAAKPYLVLRTQLMASGLWLETRDQENSGSMPDNGCNFRLLLADGHEMRSILYMDDWGYQLDCKGLSKEIYALRTQRMDSSWWMLLERFHGAPTVGGLVQYKRIGMAWTTRPTVDFKDQVLALF
ncbi:HET-domain-containing protein [Apiospora sp. TS-2023a]